MLPVRLFVLAKQTSPRTSVMATSNRALVRDIVLVDETAGDRGVTVDTAVAQEWPVAADVLERLQVDFAHQNFFSVMGTLGEHSPERIAEKRSAPEFESLAGRGLAADVAGFETDAVDDRDVNSVGDGVGSLNGAPGIVLRYAELSLLGRMPSDCGGIKKNLCTL